MTPPGVILVACGFLAARTGSRSSVSCNAHSSELHPLRTQQNRSIRTHILLLTSAATHHNGAAKLRLMAAGAWHAASRAVPRHAPAQSHLPAGFSHDLRRRCLGPLVPKRLLEAHFRTDRELV